MNSELCLEDHGQPREGSYFPPLAGAGEVTAGTHLSGQMWRSRRFSSGRQGKEIISPLEVRA